MPKMDWGPKADGLDEDRGPTFPANWGGECAGCGQRFSEGDPVYYRDGELYAEDGCEMDW